jgi:hypothetical protein
MWNDSDSAISRVREIVDAQRHETGDDMSSQDVSRLAEWRGLFRI